MPILKIAFFLLVSFICQIKGSSIDLEQEQPSEEMVNEQMTRITSCWYITSLKIKDNKKLVFEKFMSQSNRMEMFTRIQIDMVKMCYEQVDLAMAQGILEDIGRGEEFDMKYENYVKGEFEFDSYLQEGYNFELDQEEKILLKIIQNLETDFLADYEKNHKKKQIKRQKQEMKFFGLDIQVFSYYLLAIMSIVFALLVFKLYQTRNSLNKTMMNAKVQQKKKSKTSKSF